MVRFQQIIMQLFILFYCETTARNLQKKGMLANLIVLATLQVKTRFGEDQWYLRGGWRFYRCGSTFPWWSGGNNHIAGRAASRAELPRAPGARRAQVGGRVHPGANAGEQDPNRSSFIVPAHLPRAFSQEARWMPKPSITIWIYICSHWRSRTSSCERPFAICKPSCAAFSNRHCTESVQRIVEQRLQNPYNDRALHQPTLHIFRLRVHHYLALFL